MSRAARRPGGRWGGLGASAVAVGLALVGVATPGAVEAQVDGNACRSIGWQKVIGPTGPFTSLAASSALDRIYVGSRTLSDDPDEARPTLYSGSLSSLAWSAENLRDIRVSDVLITAGRAPEVWVSTLGFDESFTGPVLGRTGAAEFQPMGQLRSQYMELAATDADVFTAVSKSGQQGVYRWDAAAAPAGEWVLVGADDIATDYFRSFGAGSNGRLWLGTDRQGLWASSDAGATWSRVRGGENETIRSLAVDPANPSHVLAGLGYPAGAAGEYAKGIRYTDDGGVTWREVGPNGLATARRISALAINPLTSSEAYAAAWENGLWVSETGGLTWSPFPTPGGHSGYFDALLVVVPSTVVGCRLLVAAGSDGVWVRSLLPPPVSIFIPLAPKKIDLD